MFPYRQICFFYSVIKKDQGDNLMKAKWLIVPAALALLASSTAFAAGELELAKKSGCLACHSVEKKIVGPAWKDVSFLVGFCGSGDIWG